MSAFPTDSNGNQFVPEYALRKNNAPKTRVVAFGDGFEQRLTFGINQNPKTFNLTFNVSETDSDTIETFLDARGGVESFTYTIPTESSMSFVCSSWTKSIPYNNRSKITATFRQVFEP
jgi:phage-related protein|tara:strand:- start:380 stop:733 length:354 start_codon:yes stop_codon:yes gene_type:complete